MNLLFAQQTEYIDVGWQAPWWDRLDPLEQGLYGFVGFGFILLGLIFLFFLIGKPVIDFGFRVKGHIEEEGATESEFENRIKNVQFIELDGEL